VADHGLHLYLKEVISHINEYEYEYECELDELTQLITLNSRDYRAAERLLQLITEVSIGLAKYWLKSVKEETGSNAYQILSPYRIWVYSLKKSLYYFSKLYTYLCSYPITQQFHPAREYFD
jgi:hypothetical protein